MVEDNEINKFIVTGKGKSPWKEEDHLDLKTLHGNILHISRIVFVGDKADKKNPKRCLSITKNGKSVAFDIEMTKAIAGCLHKLGDFYVPVG